MATANLAPGATPKQSNDPFISTPSPYTSQLRYATLDSDQFTSYSTNSPAQARRALEAHLKETDRRIHDAAKLGNALLEQKKNLAERLKDVENVQPDDGVPAALQHKLAELEKEYNEVGRESARAFLPKLRPTKPDATTLSGQGSTSPSKVLAPSRRQRNQPNARVHDIEFATEISTSLLAQVRQLQAALVEKDELLKDTASARAQLETDLTGLTQRVKQMDEHTQNFKDENWNLETKIQELEGALRLSTDSEQRLGQTLKATQSEKVTAQRDLDELKVTHDKAIEAHLEAKRQQDTDLHTLRRDNANHQADKDLLQQKIDELNNNNKELARAVSYRFNQPADAAIPHDEIHDSDDDLDDALAGFDSPVKGTPARPGMLESETMKSSMQHALRTIQNLKNTIHKEKSERLELRRLLNEARDELEKRRDPVRPANTQSKKRGNERPKRATRLGADGVTTTEILTDEPGWEDDDQRTPSKNRNFSAAMPGAFVSASTTDAESTDAFETADELRTETDNFETGAESLGDESDELTETESGPNRSNIRHSSILSSVPAERRSYLSTASSDEDERQVRTPNQSVGPKYRLRVSKSARRSLRSSQIIADSPASNNSTPQNFGMSLDDELAGLDDGSVGSTPSRVREELLSSPETQRTVSNTATPVRSFSQSASPFVVAPDLQHAQLASSPLQDVDQTVLHHNAQIRPAMVDAGIMTEPWEPESRTNALPLATQQDEHVPAKSAVDESVAEAPAKGLGERLVDAAGGALAGFGLGRISKEHTPEVEVSKAAPANAEVTEGPHQRNTPLPSPVFSLSSIVAQDYEPVAAPAVAAPIIPLLPQRSSRRLGSLSEEGQAVEDVDESDRTQTPAQEKIDEAAVPVAILPTAAIADEKEFVEPKVYGGGRGANGIPTLIFGEGPNIIKQSTDSTTPTTTSDGTAHDILPITKPLQIKKQMSDEGSQTIVSGQEIDNMMRDKSQAGSLSAEDGNRSPKRPGSASSTRHKVIIPTPPLPVDHTQKIAAAAKTPAPTSVPGSMGPPLLPASAYKNKRPTTPGERSVRAMSRDGTTPRPARASVRDSSITGRASRSTSVSSFASELDERFRIGGNHLMYPDDIAPATDPRMIQAITQTMIGEYLWKYTRKAGRVETSNNRHRRFAWVHPYTRTLYWSEQDPSTTNKGTMKAKSVQIESVRVMSDDNINPPGLHRKSIVIISKNREIVMTAPTSQRHETWFNALSYLLLRSGAEKEAEDTINDEDLEEFNPTGFSFRRSISKMTRGRSRSRVSLSSYNSRTTRTSSPLKRDVAQTTGQRAQSSAPVAESISSRQGRVRDSSRFSSMASRFAPAGHGRGSVTSRTGAGSSLSNREGEMYNSSVMGESAEDVRKIIERQDRDADMLENVRACCDGKHDVGSLSRRGKHASIRSRMSGSHQHHHHHDQASEASTIDAS